jgi:hypothetical protein
MPPIISPFVSLAFSRLRRAVTVCCWVVAGALLCQLLVWCFATFTQVRFETIQAKATPGAIVISRENKPVQPAPILVNSAAQSESAGPEVKPADPNRVMSRFEQIFARASALALAAGSVAMLVLLPLVAVGLLLGVTSATNGVENTVSAFVWSLVVGLFILPIGQHIGLPWQEGALTSYATMTQQVDLSLAGAQEAWGSATFYARFALMPLVCVCGLAIIGLRFNVGVGSGIIPKENLRLDPALEKEVANIKVGSLHGGRAAGAMRAAGMTPAAERKPMATSAAPATAGAGVTSAGETPRRLI